MRVGYAARRCMMWMRVLKKGSTWFVGRKGKGFFLAFSHHLLPTKETAGSQTGGVAPGCWRCHWAKNLLPQTELLLMRTMMKTSFVIVTAAANCCSPEKILRHQPKHQETNTLIFDNHKPPFWFLFPLTIGQFVRKTALPCRKLIMWKMSSFTSNRFHHFRYVVNVGSCYIHILCIRDRCKNYDITSVVTILLCWNWMFHSHALVICRSQRGSS